MIVGAIETRPGIMYVELLNTSTDTVEELYVYTEDYLQCWDSNGEFIEIEPPSVPHVEGDSEQMPQTWPTQLPQLWW